MLTYADMTLVGRLTQKPELRYTQSGIAVANMTVAVDRPVKREDEKVTDFFDVTVWRGTAEFCAEHLDKGQAVFVHGRPEIQTYEDRDGRKQRRLRVQANMLTAWGGGNGQSRGRDDDLPPGEEIDPGDEPLPF